MKHLAEYITETKARKNLYKEIFDMTYDYITKANQEGKKGYSDIEIDDRAEKKKETQKDLEKELVNDLINIYKDNMNYMTLAQLSDYVKDDDNKTCEKDVISNALAHPFAKVSCEKKGKKYEDNK